MTIELDGNSLTISDVVKVARTHEEVVLSESAKEKMNQNRKCLESMCTGEIIYGVNTGFGPLCKECVEDDQLVQLQENIILSHACAVGDPLPTEVVRAMMLLRANSLAKGYSGVRPVIVEVLIEMLNKKVHPIVPGQGSVGASGDLALLSHIALALIGKGEVEYVSRIISSEKAFESAGINQVTLALKEGLALINGTQAMTAIGCLVFYDAKNLVKTSEVAAGISIEVLMGTDKVFNPSIHSVRPHKGQVACAANMRKLLANSGIIKSHKGCGRIQDAYSLRCTPQVLGAAKDVLDYVEKVLAVEVNSAVDNPLVFDDKVLSGGNFHGEPVAFAMDFLAIALSEVANISERRIARMVDEHLSEGLPAFLIVDSGLNSGFMIPQYTAASLVSENKGLCHPASVDSIPTSANQEDHVSMGTTAARKALQVYKNSAYVIAIELLCGSQAADFRKPLQLANGTNAAYQTVRRTVPKVSHDTPIYEYIERIDQLVKSNEILTAVEKSVGKLE